MVYDWSRAWGIISNNSLIGFKDSLFVLCMILLGYLVFYYSVDEIICLRNYLLIKKRKKKMTVELLEPETIFTKFQGGELGRKL